MLEGVQHGKTFLPDCLIHQVCNCHCAACYAVLYAALYAVLCCMLWCAVCCAVLYAVLCRGVDPIGRAVAKGCLSSYM